MGRVDFSVIFDLLILYDTSFLSVKKNLLFRHSGFLPDTTGAGSDIHAVKKMKSD
jgi:hypothetical protein